MTETEDTPRRRDTYHHGHLHEALVDEALRMARSGGAEAVVLREATRQAGVSPNAAYRHFANREALLDEVSLVASDELGQVMWEAAQNAPASADGRNASTDEGSGTVADQVVAACAAYVDFALGEPGLFDVAFATSEECLANLRDSPSNTHMGPEEVLRRLLTQPGVRLSGSTDPDALVLLVWSMLHGFSVLSTSGPLRVRDKEAMAKGLLAVVDSSMRKVLQGD